MTDWGISTDLGDGWYPIPLDVDPEEFGAYVLATFVEEAPELTGQELHPERAEALAAEFVAMTEHAQRTNAYACALYRPDFTGPTVAMAESHVLEPEGRTALLERVHEEYAALGGEVTVTETELPIGAAVRVHHVTGPGGVNAEAAVVESVVFFFEAPGHDIVRHGLSWTATGFGADLEDLADRIAQGLAFQ